jgi:hypothetical protein
MVMRVASRMSLIVATLLCACVRGAQVPASDTLAAQQAAIEFLARQSSTAVCVRIASGPNDLVDGMVANNLQDPPSELLSGIRRKGVTARPYSACDKGIVIAVGWPAIAGNSGTVRADWL